MDYTLEELEQIICDQAQREGVTPLQLVAMVERSQQRYEDRHSSKWETIEHVQLTLGVVRDVLTIAGTIFAIKHFSKFL
jgi:hypothetical protein